MEPMYYIGLDVHKRKISYESSCPFDKDLSWKSGYRRSAF
jgi:hypothetical protein